MNPMKINVPGEKAGGLESDQCMDAMPRKIQLPPGLESYSCTEGPEQCSFEYNAGKHFLNSLGSHYNALTSGPLLASQYSAKNIGYPDTENSGETAALKLEVARLQRELMSLLGPQRQQHQTLQGQRRQQTPPGTWLGMRQQPCQVGFKPATEVPMPRIAEIANDKLDETIRGAITNDGLKKIVQHAPQSTQSTVDTLPGMELSTDAGSSALCSSDDGSELGDGMKTTQMMQNVPNDYSRQMLLDLLDNLGFADKYDFVYLPLDFKTKRSLGYAFLNFVSEEAAIKFHKAFDGFSNWGLPSRKVCQVSWSALQGIEAHIECYRNSPVMHPSVPEQCRPLLYKDGQQLPFPEPTKKIREPRQWNRRRH